MRTNKKSWLATATAVQLAAATLVLAACGGGDSAVAPPPVVVAPPAPASLTIGGTAATGAALASAAVLIKCVGANGTATTGTDGVYSVAIVGASLPCVLSVSSGATTLRSVAEAGSATTAVVNITPLSEIIVARLAGGDAATLFTTFDAAAQAKLSSSLLADARTAVTTALKGAIDLSGIDPIKDALVAASAGKTGNALDQKLDSLSAALKAGGTTLADLAAALVANPNAPAVVQTLLQPVASSCAALRSGKFHALDAANISAAVSTRTVDAAKLTVTKPDGTVKTLTAKTDSACEYTMDGGATSVFVARSGVVLMRYVDGASVGRAMLLVPDQTVPLAELAGTWNIAMYGGEPFGNAAATSYTVETLNASSLVTAGADCVGLNACVPWTPRPSDIFSLSSEGGYASADDEGSARVFAVKTAAGQIALFGMLFDTKKQPLGLLFFSKQVALALPTVGQVDKFWDVEINYNGAQTPINVLTTVKTVDTSAMSYTRERTSDGRIDGFSADKPRTGMRYRPAGSSVLASGATIKFGESLVTPMPGMGLAIYSNVTPGTNNYFGISVIKP